MSEPDEDARLRLTDAEREAVEACAALLAREAANETMAAWFSADHKARYTAEADRMGALSATLRGLLERTQTGKK